MDKYEQRRLNLKELVEKYCGGTMAELANKLDRSTSYVSRMLYEDGKDGRKRIGEDMADVITNAFGLRKGWLDVPHNSLEAVQNGQLGGLPSGMAQGPSVTAVVEQVTAMVTLKLITENEASVLIAYRVASERGRDEIRGICEYAERDQLFVVNDQAKS